MSKPLRQFGKFLLTKAAGPAADLFQESEGSGAKTWMQTGVFWLVLAGIGGFLSAWHNYDPAALDSLSNIGWSYDDVLPYFSKSENYRDGGDRDYRGNSGVLEVQDARTTLPLTD